MIQEIEGDLLCFPTNILCHQTNYYGVMDGGIAAAIRKKILTDRAVQRIQGLLYVFRTSGTWNGVVQHNHPQREIYCKLLQST